MLENSAAFNVLNISIAIVMGPTPPGTGVIALAIIAALLKSTSPVSFDFVSPFDDGCVAREVGIGGRDVVEALVVAVVVVMEAFCLIFVPFGHYDEPESLPYEKPSIRPKGADVRHGGPHGWSKGCNTGEAEILRRKPFVDVERVKELKASGMGERRRWG